MRLALAFALLVGCGGEKKAPPPAPASGTAAVTAPAADPMLVDGIRGLCATNDLNVAEAALAMRDWTANMAATKNKAFADIYLAALDGDDAAYAKLKTAAEVAAPGKCQILDDVVKRARDRDAEIAALPPPGPASDALVADMQHFCKGPDGLADMNPAAFRELNVLVAKGEYVKARDAVTKAKLADCAPLEQLIESAQARKAGAK